MRRPRLEVTKSSEVSGSVTDNGNLIVDGTAMSIKDAKRLHAFLTKAIAYLEQKEKK